VLTQPPPPALLPSFSAQGPQKATSTSLPTPQLALPSPSMAPLPPKLLQSDDTFSTGAVSQIHCVLRSLPASNFTEVYSPHPVPKKEASSSDPRLTPQLTLRSTFPSSVAEHLPSMPKTLSWIPSITKTDTSLGSSSFFHQLLLSFLNTHPLSQACILHPRYLHIFLT
jgi:hypothetical protein